MEETADPTPPSLGPVLHLRDADARTARFAVTRALPEGAAPPVLRAAGGEPEPAEIGRLAGAVFWSWEFALPLGEEGAYEMDGVRRAFRVPGAGAALRLAYASCNGGEDEAHAASLPGGRDAMWAHLRRRHETAPFHLLVMGGDQVYADALWRLPSMREWGRLGRRARLRAPFTPRMRAELEAHYLRTYASVFGAPEVAAVVAGVPCLMMWDDHDVVDGWGSRPAAWQASPVAQGLFAVARRAFGLVQLGCDPDRPPSGHMAPDGAHLGWRASYGAARIAVPDLRSERTRRRVMGPRGTRDLDAALEPRGAAHLLLVSSVPMVNADLSAAERVVTPLMPLADLYQDDLRDQWMSHAHRAEWLALTDRLLGLAAAGTRVTVLSGEIHFGAHGTAERDGARLEQLTASGIAHPPPPRALARALEALTRRPWRRAGVRLAMHPIAPDGRRYLAERNWLELALHPDGASEAVLHGEFAGALALGAPAREAPPEAAPPPAAAEHP